MLPSLLARGSPGRSDRGDQLDTFIDGKGGGGTSSERTYAVTLRSVLVRTKFQIWDHREHFYDSWHQFPNFQVLYGFLNAKRGKSKVSLKYEQVHG